MVVHVSIALLNQHVLGSWIWLVPRNAYDPEGERSRTVGDKSRKLMRERPCNGKAWDHFPGWKKRLAKAHIRVRSFCESVRFVKSGLTYSSIWTLFEWCVLHDLWCEYGLTNLICEICDTGLEAKSFVHSGLVHLPSVKSCERMLQNSFR